MRKPADPRHTCELAQSQLERAKDGRVDISATLLRDLIALARAWVYTRPQAEAIAPFVSPIGNYLSKPRTT